MIDHGILMKGEMVRAYFAGSKWMTRRTRGLGNINKNPDAWEFLGFQEIDGIMNAIFRMKSTFEGMTFKPPYGWLGDRLWVKETWRELIDLGAPGENSSSNYIDYRADCTIDFNPEAKWKSSMFMPRWASRISLPIVNVRVQRVQDILLGDVAAEGWPDAPKTNEIWTPELLKAKGDGFSWFITLWDSINGKRGMGWEVNPWVWVYEFPKYSKLEENAVIPLLTKR